jgi:hypothetical protein
MEVRGIRGAAIVSQSCDASLPHRERIQVAPVVELEDPMDVLEASSGQRTQYVALPQLGGACFVDLDGVTTVQKVALLPYQRIPGVASDKEVREFAFSVSRRFGRFAFPDDVVACLQPLGRVLASKARKPKSDLGRVLAQVHSFRIACDDWTSTPYDLTLVVILHRGVDLLDLEDAEERPAIFGDVDRRPTGERIASYARYLVGAAQTPHGRYYAWQGIASAWAKKCEESATEKGLAGVVRSVVPELTDVDDFPISRVLETESLDLDYVSDDRKPLF